MTVWITALAGLLVALLAACATVATAPGAGGAEARDMRLVGHEPLQARSAYQPLVHKQGDRWIAYVGHHGGVRRNPITGRDEQNGTSIVDVTDPTKPRYLTHIPGAPGEAEGGGASMVRICDGRELPRADRAKTYLLRALGRLAHEVWDVSDPAKPAMLTTVIGGLGETHKNWWECDTGIAYLVADGRPQGWRTNRMTKIYDLSDPTNPRFIRDFGLGGQEPGSNPQTKAPAGLHGPIAYRGRVYFAYGTGADGVLQIVDRTRLLNGDPAHADPFKPTPENLKFPEIGRLDMPPDWGGHTSYPVIGIPIRDHILNLNGRVRDFVVLVSESLRNECQEFRQLTFLVDVTTPSKPFSVATFEVPESPGDFCRRGGRFGPHSSHESFYAPYYGKLIFLAYFNGGVRVVDIRNPFAPREAAYFVPAVTEATEKRCLRIDGVERCKIAIQTNNVEVDERGLIYLADRASTGLHIVELTGAAKAIAE
ncbi:MAG TPA: hypothetical protein VGQ77_11135 [Methylomirabilota bacterium]|jgi:hypothetical protein|nr:hypothetical protein [Methylomirabilota bacterium]